MKEKIYILCQREMIIILEINNIYNMDCIEALKQMDNDSVDMFFVDLPYGVTAKNKWDNVIPIEPMWEQVIRVAKPTTPILFFGQDKFTAKMMLSQLKLHRYNIIWEKTTPTGHLNAKKMPLRIHEDIMVFYQKLPTYNPQKTTGHKRKVSTAENKLNCIKTSNYGDFGLTTYDSTERYPTSIWKFATDKQQISLHPTQKPLDLCRYAIRTYSNAGDLVVDFCCGSGTIPKAAQLEHRNYIGIDNGVCERKGKFEGWYWADIAKYRLKNMNK